MKPFSWVIFAMVQWAARNGLSPEKSVQQSVDETEAETVAAPAQQKLRHRRTGVRGETYAYWYLRRHGYVMVARNFMVPGVKGEIDLIGYDGAVLSFVEVKTRTGEAGAFGGPEDAVTPEKRRHLARMARLFLADRRIPKTKWRFDVLAIDAPAGRRPEVRLHKDAFADH